MAASEADRAEREAQTAHQVTDFLVGLFEVSDPSKALGDTITAREILDRGVKKIGDELKDQPLVRTTLQDTMGRVYTSLGLYDPAEELLREALSTRRSLLGDEHADVANSLHNLARVLGSKGLYDEGDFVDAEQAAREALTIRRRLFGDEHKDVAASLDALAGVLGRRHHFAEAEPLYREALGINRKLYGDEHKKTVDFLHNLALMFLFQRKFDDAEPLFREVLVLERKRHGGEHPDIAITLGNLAFLLENKGQYDEAARLSRESIAIGRKVLGNDHPHLAGNISLLADLVERKGDFEDAESLARESLSICDAAKVPSNHPHRLNATSVLASALAHRGHFVEAEPMLLQAYDGLKDDEIFQIWAIHALERIVRTYGSWDAAEPGKGYAEKAAQWRVKLEEVGTEAPRHEGTEGKEDSRKP